ncbi:hypothetical protein [Microcoleus asticus]|uniref:Uncharacterized protein n=1 Tax=Microcoleus asticus IPMA8 TaxID=2563858 RepID=A0ABX2D6J7_9CYAN|nr:hypothetical protein [Microcoleus asticus]NQE38196.1 hypothetical protein [Microcoleus asticus IPMA8]
MQTQQTHIALSDLRLQVDAARINLENLKAQQVQHLAKARSEVQTVDGGIAQWKANEREFGIYKMWQSFQIFPKLR